MGEGWQGFDIVRIVASGGLVLLLIWLSAIDFRLQRLPNKIVLPMLGFGLGLNALGVFTSPLDAILGAIAGYGSLWCLGALYSLRRPVAFGGGDLKLTAALGAWLGLSCLPLILLCAFVAGSCVAIPLVLIGRCRVDQRIPFGPALALGGVIALLGGANLVSNLYAG